ncbi:MAG: peptidoglycan DD-metalloendopeptidase family protein [Fusobacteriaceae bacterium]|nr:peptidoglycan DD-metalloendopeptidase family protein [Fusobacteriaceae bacterium]
MKKTLAIIFLSIIQINIFAKDVSNLENRVKVIDKQIEVKTNRIKTIDGEKNTIANQINEIEKEINSIEKDQNEIIKEISIVSKNIDYGEKSLALTSVELKNKKSEYGAKILVWDKYIKNRGNRPEESLVRKNFRSLLYGDLSRMEHIQNVQFDIKKVKTEIESERKKLGELQAKLNQNRKNMDAKRDEKNDLIAQLSKEQKGHTKDIANLRREKERINREITRIINSSTTRDTSIATISQAALKIGKLKRPVSGSIVVGFGQTKGGAVESYGIEIAAKVGTKITAAANGKVVYADKFQGLGSVVMINYGYNTIGVYGNLISLSVKLNQQVTKGEEIGILGLSSDKKPNLYYELRFNSKPINPVPYF